MGRRPLPVGRQAYVVCVTGQSAVEVAAPTGSSASHRLLQHDALAWGAPPERGTRKCQRLIGPSVSSRASWRSVLLRIRSCQLLSCATLCCFVLRCAHFMSVASKKVNFFPLLRKPFFWHFDNFFFFGLTLRTRSKIDDFDDFGPVQKSVTQTAPLFRWGPDW